MDVLLISPSRYERFYNCSSYEFSKIPMEQRMSLPLALLTVGVAIMLEVLYVPCLWVIAKRQNLSQSCYKFMLALGLVNCFTIGWIGCAQTVFSIQGTVFCAQPTIIYLAGMGNSILWFAESGISLVLALNRLLSICHRSMAEFLFGGQRAWIWLCYPMCLTIFMAFYARPFIFNSIHHGWFQNPHMGYLEALNAEEDAFYYPTVQWAYNSLLIFALFSIYAIFLVILIRTRENGQQNQQRDIRIFIQVFWISLSCAVAALGFAFEQHLVQYPAIIQLLNFGYFLHQGSPALIYLLLNKSIRFQIFCCQQKSATILPAAAPANCSIWKGTAAAAAGGGGGTATAVVLVANPTMVLTNGPSKRGLTRGSE